MFGMLLSFAFDFVTFQGPVETPQTAHGFDMAPACEQHPETSSFASYFPHFRVHEGLFVLSAKSIWMFPRRAFAIEVAVDDTIVGR